MPATDAFQALTPQQVNSWPVATLDENNSGDSAEFYGSGTKEGFLRMAMERFQLCADASGTQRREALIDTQFAAGNQWDPTIEAERSRQRRPCLTINRIDGFLAHAVNSFRQQRPEIKVIAAADGADKDIAEVEEGLIRHIQVNSAADTPYDEAFKQMCTGGLSWLRVVDDWAAPDSMDQELFIRGVANPFDVYADPFCRQPDWSDMRYAFVVEDLTRAEFKKRWPKSEVNSLDNFASIGDQQKYWFPDGKIRTAEYFHVELEDDILCELEDKTTRLLSKLPQRLYFVDKSTTGDLALFMRTSGDFDDPGEYVGRARKCKIPQVYWAKITAMDVLQERKWKGRYIPLIPVLGNQIEMDGDRILVGMVRYAREPQRMYNYMYTSFVETVALLPRAPFIAEVGQIPDGAIRDSWAKYATDPQVVMFYKSVASENGQALPPPQRQVADPPIAAFVQGLAMADNNLKSVFRIFDASLGQRGPQESGLAINARKMESDTGIYNWSDNFIRALRYLGTVIEDLLPAYYNTEGRVFQLIQQDDTTKRVVMNQAPSKENKQDKQYDLEQGGNYRIVITTGPSYQTKRQEAAQSMIDFFKLYPAGLQACAHILVSEFDFPGRDKLKEQLEKILPPNLQVMDADGTPDSGQLQTQLSQATQQIQQLTAALHEATDKRLLQRDKEEWETFRTQMQEERQLASDAMKTGAQSAQFLSEKIFEELNLQRALLSQALNPPQPGAAGAPGSGASPAPAGPVLAGPPTAGGVQAPVGG